MPDVRGVVRSEMTGPSRDIRYNPSMATNGNGKNGHSRRIEFLERIYREDRRRWIENNEQVRKITEDVGKVTEEMRKNAERSDARWRRNDTILMSMLRQADERMAEDKRRWDEQHALILRVEERIEKVEERIEKVEERFVKVEERLVRSDGRIEALLKIHHRRAEAS